MSSIPSQQVADTTAVPSPSMLTFRFARAVSDVLCPPVLAVPAMLLSMWLCGMNNTLPYAALYFAIAVVPPVLYVLYLVQSGQVQDFHLPERKERIKPFIASIAASLVAWGVLCKLGAPPLFNGIIFALIVQVAILLTITLFWQISIHAATVTGFVVFAMLATWPILGNGALAWIPLIPLVAWSRLYLKRHTMSQIVMGTTVGLVTIVVTTRGLLW
jgi:membrane-associated phospholipid phosphatase